MTINYLLGDESSSDTISTEGGDGLLLYSISSTDGLLYSFNVDWDGDGDFDGENEADYLLKWTSSRGRERIFKPSGRGFQPYEIGRLTITLDNSNGRFDPWNTSSPLYGNLMPGRDMEFKVAYDSTSATGHDTYAIFTGTITDIQTSGYKNQVNIICEDGWRFLADWSYFDFPFGTGAGGVSNELYYVIFATSTYSVDGGYVYPLHDHPYPFGRAFVTGASSTDLPRHRWYEGSAKGAVEYITFGSLGRSWIRADGEFDFGDFRETTDAATLTLDEDDLLKNVYMPAPWDNLRSEIVLKGSNNFWYASQSVARINAPIKVDAGATVDFTLRVSSTDITIDGDYCPRITAYSLTANTGPSTTDTAIPTTDISYEVNPYVRTFDVQITNDSTSNGYINEFEITGEMLDVVDAEWTYETTSAYRNAAFILENHWLSVTAVGSTGGYFEETSTTLDDRARINTVGETLKSYLSTVKAYPVIQLQGRWSYQFPPELEDKIALTIGTLGIDDDYRITKIKHESLGSPQDVRTTIWLYPVMTPVEST